MNLFEDSTDDDVIIFIASNLRFQYLYTYTLNKWYDKPEHHTLTSVLRISYDGITLLTRAKTLLLPNNLHVTVKPVLVTLWMPEKSGPIKQVITEWLLEYMQTVLHSC
jgi:hypothetical protein